MDKHISPTVPIDDIIKSSWSKDSESRFGVFKLKLHFSIQKRENNLLGLVLNEKIFLGSQRKGRPGARRTENSRYIIKSQPDAKAKDGEEFSYEPPLVAYS
jgi:hypothetical protein